MPIKHHKPFFITLLTISTTLFCPQFISTKASAYNLYIGTGFGEAQGKIGTQGIDDKQAFTAAFGTSLDIPLFPIRLELEYDNYRMETNTLGLVNAKSYGITGYLSLPLLPILIPYIGVNLGTMKETYTNYILNTSTTSNWEFIPQYIIGLDLDLPKFPLAGSLEFRFAKQDFDFTGEKLKTKYNVFLVKPRIKF